MARDEQVSLRQVAAALDIEPNRLYRLGRHFHFAPGDPCVPRSVVDRAKAEVDLETRYRLILASILSRVREDGSRRS
jgi:hypothetical protein